MFFHGEHNHDSMHCLSLELDKELKYGLPVVEFVWKFRGAGDSLREAGISSEFLRTQGSSRFPMN